MSAPRHEEEKAEVSPPDGMNDDRANATTLFFTILFGVLCIVTILAVMASSG